MTGKTNSLYAQSEQITSYKNFPAWRKFIQLGGFKFDFGVWHPSTRWAKNICLLVQLHSNKSNAYGRTGRRNALVFLCFYLLLSGIITILPRPHFQVDNTRAHEIHNYIFQHHKHWVALSCENYYSFVPKIRLVHMNINSYDSSPLNESRNQKVVRP